MAPVPIRASTVCVSVDRVNEPVPPPIEKPTNSVVALLVALPVAVALSPPAVSDPPSATPAVVEPARSAWTSTTVIDRPLTDTFEFAEIELVVEVAFSVAPPERPIVPPSSADVCCTTAVSSRVPLPPSRDTPTKLADALVLFVDVAVAESVVPFKVAPLSLPALVEPPSDVLMNCAAPTPMPTLTPVVVTFGVEIEVDVNVAAPVSPTSAPDLRRASVAAVTFAKVVEMVMAPASPMLTLVCDGVAVLVPFAVRPSVFARR
jgi:hypothetical protein